jgi:hypothetical protein
MVTNRVTLLAVGCRRPRTNLAAGELAECALLKSGLQMTGFHPTADVLGEASACPLLTQSGLAVAIYNRMYFGGNLGQYTGVNEESVTQEWEHGNGPRN